MSGGSAGIEAGMSATQADVRFSDAPPRLRILVVDDHEVVRRGLVSYLGNHGQFEVVAEAGNCADAISQARRFVPDLVLLDVRLPDASGIEACRLMRDEFPSMQVVFLTSSPEEEDVLAAIVAGARGYVLKQTRSAELVRTLEAVGRGESLLDPTVTGIVLERIRHMAGGKEADHAHDLTVREREILPLIADGMTNKEIAALVFLSDKTVKNNVSSILAKLGLDRRAQIPAFVARRAEERPRE
jgi:two-component system response regulator DevR